MSEPAVPPVEDMRFCPWEQAMRPVGHQCIGDGQDPAGWPDFTAGSPGDLA